MILSTPRWTNWWSDPILVNMRIVNVVLNWKDRQQLYFTPIIQNQSGQIPKKKMLLYNAKTRKPRKSGSQQSPKKLRNWKGLLTISHFQNFDDNLFLEPLNLSKFYSAYHYMTWQSFAMFSFVLVIKIIKERFMDCKIIYIFCFSGSKAHTAARDSKVE